MIHGGRCSGTWDDGYPGDGTLRLGIQQGNGQLWLVAPEPTARILIADEFLWTLAYHPEDAMPGVTLEWEQPCSAGVDCQQRWGTCYRGAKLTIDAYQRKLIYIVDDYEPVRQGWWAQWPD